MRITGSPCGADSQERQDGPHTHDSRCKINSVGHYQDKRVYVFPGRDGGQRKHFRRIAERVRDKAGLPKGFRYNHGLRHAYASALASSGNVDLYTLQKLLTHGSPAMTQRYAHLADAALMKAARVAEKALASKQDGIE